MNPPQMIETVDLTRFYWAAGTLIIMNFGTVVTVFAAAARALWWISKLHSQVEQNTKDINAAHCTLRKINGKD